LDQFYPNKYQLHIETKLNEGFRIEISLPTKFHLNEND
jgi:hypothetical protein